MVLGLCVFECVCELSGGGCSRNEMRDRGTSGGADCTRIDKAACQR